MLKNIYKLVSSVLILIGIFSGVSAQAIPEPPREVGVFMEIVGGLDIDETITSTDSIDVRFNAYFIPPDDSSATSFHVVFNVNNNDQIMDFTMDTSGIGAPEGVEVFEEEGVWYIYTESYTGVDSYEFECSAVYPDGSESEALVFDSDGD